MEFAYLLLFAVACLIAAVLVVPVADLHTEAGPSNGVGGGTGAARFARRFRRESGNRQGFCKRSERPLHFMAVVLSDCQQQHSCDTANSRGLH
jgi:hypothetical protein